MTNFTPEQFNAWLSYHFPNTIFQVFPEAKGSIGYAQVIPEFNLLKFKRLNEQGYGIYFTPNGFNQRRKIDHLTSINAVFGDLDIAKEDDNMSKEERGRKKQKLLNALYSLEYKPSMTIVTKNGLQPIWLIDQQEPTEENKKMFREAIEGIIEWSKGQGCYGDQVKDLARVLRLPSFNHVKGTPYPIKFVKYSEVFYDLAKLHKFFSQYNVTNNKILNSFTPKSNEKVKNDKSYSNPLMNAINAIDIRLIVERAHASIGNRIEWDNQGRIIINGRLSGNFLGKNDDRQYIATTSGTEPFQGNKITVVAQILNCKNSEAYRWIIKEFNLEWSKEEKKKEIEEQIQKIESKVEEEVTDLFPRKHFTFGTADLDKKGIIFVNSYILIAGETGGGKTTFAFDMAVKNSKLGHKVLYFSLEMSTNEMYYASARRYAGYTVEEEKSATLPQTKKEAFKKRVQELKSNKNLELLGIANMDLLKFSVIESYILQKKPNIVFIDNFDLIAAETENENDFERQRNISLRIKTFCQQHKIPIVLLHHYRKKDAKGMQTRGIDDIRGSNKVSHDASYVLQLHRSMKWESARERDEMCISFAKSRFYEIGNVSVFFQHGTFIDEQEYERIMQQQSNTTYNNIKEVFGVVQPQMPYFE